MPDILNLDGLQKRLTENIGRLVVLDRDIVVRNYATGCFHMGCDSYTNQRFAGMIEKPGFAEDLHPRYHNMLPAEFVLGYITVKSSLDFSLSPFISQQKQKSAKIILHDLSETDLNIYPDDFAKHEEPLPYEKIVVMNFNVAIGDDEIKDFLSEKYLGDPNKKLNLIKEVLKKGELREYDYDDSSTAVSLSHDLRTARRSHAL